MPTCPAAQPLHRHPRYQWLEDLNKWGTYSIQISQRHFLSCRRELAALGQLPALRVGGWHGPIDVFDACKSRCVACTCSP